MSGFKKARKFREKNAPFFDESQEKRWLGWEDRFAAAFAESEAALAREQERIECAKAVCFYCRDSRLPKAALFGKVWGHWAGSENYVECKAALIHERGKGWG